MKNAAYQFNRFSLVQTDRGRYTIYNQDERPVGTVWQDKESGAWNASGQGTRALDAGSIEAAMRIWMS